MVTASGHPLHAGPSPPVPVPPSQWKVAAVPGVSAQPHQKLERLSPAILFASFLKVPVSGLAPGSVGRMERWRREILLARAKGWL